MKYTEPRVLKQLPVQWFIDYRSDAGEFCSIVKKNLQLLRSKGFDTTDESNYKLNTQKLNRCIAESIGINPDLLTKREATVDWLSGESLLLTYAECACAKHDLSPFALRRVHAETLSHIFAQRTKNIRQSRKEFQDLYFGELLSAEITTLRRPWDLDPSDIHRIRRNTQEFRAQIHEGISILFGEHLERVGTDDYHALTTITSDDLDSLEEHREEMKKRIGSTKDLARSKVVVSGVLGGSISALTSVLTLPIFPLSVILGIVAGKVTETTLQSLFKRSHKKDLEEIQRNPLYSTIVFIDKIKDAI